MKTAALKKLFKEQLATVEKDQCVFYMLRTESETLTPDGHPTFITIDVLKHPASKLSSFPTDLEHVADHAGDLPLFKKKKKIDVADSSN